MGAAMKWERPLVANSVAAPAPAPQPVVKPQPVAGAVGTGQRIAVQRKNRNGHTVQVIDATLAPEYHGGLRWVVINLSTGRVQRFAGKRDAKAAIASA